MDKFARSLLDSARADLERTGEFPAKLIAQGAQTVAFDMGGVPHNLKWALAERFGQAAARFKPKTLILLSDVYIKTATDPGLASKTDEQLREEMRHGRQLRDDPEAGEALVLTISAKDFCKLHAVWPYTRNVSLDHGTKFVFGEIEEVPADARSIDMFAEHFFAGVAKGTTR